MSFLGLPGCAEFAAWPGTPDAMERRESTSLQWFPGCDALPELSFSHNQLSNVLPFKPFAFFFF